MFTQKFVTYGLRTGSYTKLVKALYSKSIQHEVKEVEIPVPWGKVAGKLWGSQDKQPILAMHGWQDNAASFDNIAPLIMKHTPVLAIDLPGHGLSSWIPPGFMYDELIYLLLMKRIKNHFGWEKIKVLGHSLSAMTTYWYGACFPKELQYVIALDVFKFVSMDPIAHITLFANALKAFFKVEKSTVQPSYKTQSEIIEKARKGFLVLDDASYKILMTRGTTRKEDGTYVINRDPRLRAAPIHSVFSQDQLEAYTNLIKCPYLIIKGDENFYAEEKENFYRALEILKAANDKVQFEAISATHHLHLTHAESTAAIIIPFLEKYD
ncbi:probable serine hydrolase [Solenopsis invicta]|uniref:probable serine hydrolase n=1 Tax=Solenopsis invicta TaxID=13686 RepID=UPI000595C066|nr:probable serine hydrolase [Solenopsis invicta]XP_011161348.1 probable serine hydrolase [Solenopsis invicta]